MTQPYKVCPQCQTAATLEARACAVCGRQYRTQFATPEPQTTTFIAPGIPYLPQGQQYAPVPQDITNKRILAGIIGILLGGLGIHKFILGRTQAGIIMLLVSIFVSLFTCGIGYLVMHVIGLIEGIIYLSKSDAEFYQLYMIEKKDWL